MNELIGQQLGPYRIVEQIGTGGMATVYKAYQPAMDRYVAVKVIASHFAQDEMFLNRFRREAKAVARLEHAHILPVYDSGEAEGRLYLVMRYLEAGTLKDRMVHGPLPLGEVNHIIGQVGSALDYAHRMGVIHRDIKPSNVLIDAEGNSFLTDFGLAKMTESSTQLTGTGVGVGTPAYMSPEQGKGAKIDSRADVYSLGVVLYEMVTGRAPYEAETPLAVVIKHITEPLPLPRSVNPDLPEEVERVILRAMAKEPDDRFGTVAEMVQALDAAVRASEAATPTEPAVRAERVAPTLPTAPAAPDAADEPVETTPARKVADLRKGLPPEWGRIAAWVAAGLVALVVLTLILSRVPLRVQISGGQLEVVRVVEETPAPSEPAPSEVREPEETTAPPSPPPTLVLPMLTLQMQLRVTSTSDWAEVTVVSGETIIHQQTVDTGGMTTMAQMEGRLIELDQDIERAAEGNSIYIVQDVTVDGVTANKEMVFRVEKGCIGVTTVEVFNVATGTSLLVERFANDTCDGKIFTVGTDVLATTSVPPTLTPEPVRPREIYPLAPDGGRVINVCENTMPPQLCAHDIATNQFTPVTNDLEFEQLGSSSWSPDGERIVFSAGSGQFNDHNLYIINTDGSGLRQLTRSDVQDQTGEWSPDGEWIAFLRDGDLWRVRPDGSDEQVLFAPDEGGVYATWSPDSQQLAFLYFRTETDQSIWVINADGSDPHQMYAFEGERLAGGGCVWTPDGDQILCWYDEVDSEGIEQRVLINGDGSGISATIGSVPYWWQSNYWPRWGGEGTPPFSPADQVRAFAEPILTALGDRAPDYADAFTSPDSGWSVGQNAGWSARYEDEAYILEALPGVSANGHWLTLPSLQDFVLETEMQQLSGSQGDWAILLRYTEVQDNGNGLCAILFRLGDPVSMVCCLDDYCPLGADVPPEFVNPFDQVNRVTIIARGPQIAVAVNDHWSMLETDPFYNIRSPQIRLALGLSNVAESGDTPFRVRWDNLKIWDISDQE